VSSCHIIIIVYYARRQQDHTNKKHKITQHYIQLKNDKTPHTKKSHQSTDEAKLHHTAFLIDTSYELTSYFAPVAMHLHTLASFVTFQAKT